MTAEPGTRKQRETQRTPVAPLESIRKRLDRTPAEFSADLGYSPQSYSDWLRLGTAPKVAGLAAEALARRQAADDIVFVVRVVKGVAEVALIDEGASIATIAGRRYMMVPT